MEKKVIEVKDEATALKMERKFFDDSDIRISSLDDNGYKLVLQKYDKKVDSMKEIPADANLIEETEYIIAPDILNIYADFNYLDVDAVFEDGTSFSVDSTSVKENPDWVLDDIIFFEEYNHSFESVEIEPGLKTYLEELLGRTEEDE